MAVCSVLYLLRHVIIKSFLKGNFKMWHAFRIAVKVMISVKKLS